MLNVKNSNNISVQYNGGFLPDITLLTQSYHHWVFSLTIILCSVSVFTAYEIESYTTMSNGVLILHCCCFYWLSGVPT